MRRPVVGGSLGLVRLATAAFMALFLGSYVVHLLTGFQPDGRIGQLFGSYDLYWRGPLLAIAILVGLGTAIARQKSIEPEFKGWEMAGLLPGTILWGLIGGRIAALLLPMPSLAAAGITNFGDALAQLTVALNLRQGGIALGGVILGGGGFLAWRRGLTAAAVEGLIAGQLIALWANFFEQSAYGPPTSWWIGQTVDPLNRLPQWASFDRFHPLFLYEILCLLMIWLFWPKVVGQTFSTVRAVAWYAALVGPVRAVITWFDPNTFHFTWSAIPVAAWSIIWLFVALVGWLVVGSGRSRP